MRAAQCDAPGSRPLARQSALAFWVWCGARNGDWVPLPAADAGDQHEELVHRAAVEVLQHCCNPTWMVLVSCSAHAGSNGQQPSWIRGPVEQWRCVWSAGAWQKVCAQRRHCS